jgi:Transcription antiterminator
MHKQDWFVLYTSPRAEKKVHERISAKGYNSWLPLHRTPRAWSDRVKLVDVPLFNSYVFVQCAESDLRDLLKIYGVVRIVYYDEKPAVMRLNEIDAIKAFLEAAANNELCPGEEVEILCGAMKSVSGKIKKIKKDYLVLYIEQLGATIGVKRSNVAKVDRIR